MQEEQEKLMNEVAISDKKQEVVYLSDSQYEANKKAELVRLGQSNKPYQDIIKYLNNEIKMSTEMANFHHQIMCFKNDGVYQLNRAIEEIYGVASAKKTERMSGGENPIETLDIVLANGMRVKAPYGKISLPDLGDDANIDIMYSNDTNILHIKGSCQFRYSSLIDRIIKRTKGLLNTDSIFKDQAIELGTDLIPVILDLSNIHNEFMILSDKTQYDLRGLMARIEKPEMCKQKGISLKTGILFEGAYGTGKTLAAFKIGAKAITKGWSFIYLKDPSKLAQTLRLAKVLDNNGIGIIIFVEDIDQVTSGNRDASMQDILNTLDGGDTKGMNVISIFTTNHIEKIEPTFLRGKRIGSIVTMGPLDSKTVRLFLNHSFADYVLEEEGLEEICDKIANKGIVPAFMAEIVETVKSNMIFEDSNTVKASYIQNSFEAYLHQVGLAALKSTELSQAEKLELALKTSLGMSEIEDKIENIQGTVDEIYGRV